MKPFFNMDDDVYQSLLDALNNQHFTDKSGDASDMDFIKEDLWLSDTAVIDILRRREGLWEIHLLFVHHQQPLKFLSRRISGHSCPKKATLMAFYMRRMAAKDQRGTLKVDIAELNLQAN
jgi:hypothetical protein